MTDLGKGVAVSPDKGVHIANAPVSFGAFEITVGEVPGVPDPIEVLDAVRDCGYEGIDLGPLGYLGNAEIVRRRLSQRGLHLAGGFIEIGFSQPDLWSSGFADLDRYLHIFEVVAEGAPRSVLPKPTLCDAGSPRRRRNPGRGERDRSLGLSGKGWRTFAEGVARAEERCRKRGFEPTFHHHTCTFVEGPSEIEQFLELTEIGLCLDSGHLIASEGDPVTAVRDWGDRINHVHLKDARRDAIPSDAPDIGPSEFKWAPQTWQPLGNGLLDVHNFIRELSLQDYEGWIVVEQDHIPSEQVTFAELEKAQAQNLAVLRAHGLGVDGDQ